MSIDMRLRGLIDDGMGRWHTARGTRPRPLAVAQLITAARQKHQLEDYGADDWRPGLDVLVAALNAADLSPAQRRRAETTIIDRLGARLQITDWAADEPMVHDETVAAPIVVVGTDPSSVHLFGQLLALDVMNRAPTVWEARNPAPPADALSCGWDPRMMPPSGADIADPANSPTRAASCSDLFANSFADAQPLPHALPEYWRWWTAADQRAAYRFHQLQLKVLQSAQPTWRWVLHAASHLWHLDALLETYPDGQVIWIHRDPPRVVDAHHQYRRVDASHGVDRSDPATWTMLSERVRTLVETSLEVRGRHPETPFFDLQHLEMIDDPVGAIERIYRDWNITLPELSRWRMQAWLDARRTAPAVDAAPAPTAASVGDRDAEMRTSVADYISAFEIPTEAPTA